MSAASGATPRGFAGADRQDAPRSASALALLGVVAALAFVALMGLGFWQVHRLRWKLDLIARVDARVHAAPSPAPAPARWPSVDAKDDAYRHVEVRGSFVPVAETKVMAVTKLGGGFWVLAPFRTDRGFVVLVNRGFVPANGPGTATALRPEPPGPTVVTGLLRIDEPGGGFLRSNDPGADRWYSRDVGAIATARHLGRIAPYFIDEDASPRMKGAPVGGLTVIAFANNHLVYALTWFGLALMLAAAVLWIGRDEIRLRGRDR